MAPVPSAPRTSIFNWYSNTTGTLLDKMCICGTSESQVQDDTEQWEAVSTYDEKRPQLQKVVASYTLPVGFDDDCNSTLAAEASIHRKVTLPIRNTSPERSPSPKEQNRLAQKHPFVSNQDDSERDMVPGRAHAQYSFKKESGNISSRPPISPSDTYTTVSLNRSMLESEFFFDENDLDEVSSTVTTEAVSHCFRSKRGRTPSHDEDGGDGGAYRYLLRMRPQNYLQDADEDGFNVNGALYQGGITFQPPIVGGNPIKQGDPSGTLLMPSLK